MLHEWCGAWSGDRETAGIVLFCPGCNAATSQALHLVAWLAPHFSATQLVTCLAVTAAIVACGTNLPEPSYYHCFYNVKCVVSSHVARTRDDNQNACQDKTCHRWNTCWISLHWPTFVKLRPWARTTVCNCRKILAFRENKGPSVMQDAVCVERGSGDWGVVIGGARFGRGA